MRSIRSRLPTLAVAAFAGAWAAGCSSNTAAGVCASNDECAAGQGCDDGTCRNLCIDASRCAASEVCSEGLCQPGRADVAPPIILSVDADGSADGAPGHAAHKLQRQLIILGDNFEAASEIRQMEEMG